MTMETTTVENGGGDLAANQNNNGSTKSQSTAPSAGAAAKRSFDVAFLTGVAERRSPLNESRQLEDDRKASPSNNNKIQQQSTAIGAKSAFKKVGKNSLHQDHHHHHQESDVSGAGMAIDLSMPTALAAPYHPFSSFPAIATTLSLQLMQQQQHQQQQMNKTSGMSSLFGHNPAAAAAAAAVAASHPSSCIRTAPSQNICAKCSLSFRMTSDLVYHMRSQHRRSGSGDSGSSSSGSTDPVIRQKRQDKLRCPVCSENFRERHHLTRHMTSHEDRDLEHSNNMK
nr:EOG090X0POW [Eubosmina coregoni]